MKKHIALLLVALMAVSVFSAAGVTTAAPMKPLPTPNLVSPKNGATFPDEPSTVLLQWKPVDSQYLKTYQVNLQVDATGTGAWYAVNIGGAPIQTTNTFYQLDVSQTSFSDARNWKWSVTALSTVTGFDSAQSGWRTFTYGTPTTERLDTPQILSPANNAKVGVGTPVTYEWKPVTGASGYLLQTEKLVDGAWTPFGPSTGTGDTSLSTNKYTGESGTFRWRVIAGTVTSDNTLIYSKPSNWRALTVY